MNGISRKLREMENNCVGAFPTTETHLDFSEFPEAERQIHFRALQILESRKAEVENVLDEAEAQPDAMNVYGCLSVTEREIVNKSTLFLQFRLFKLYLNSLQTYASDSLQEVFVAMRLIWFLQQLHLFLDQDSKENKILDNQALSEEQKDAQLGKLAETWIRPFTEESWEKYWKEHVEPSLREDLAKMPDTDDENEDKQCM